MEETSYSLGNLLPDFSRLIQGGFTTPEGLSSLFVVTLLLMTAIFLVWSLMNFRSARSRISYYKQLVADQDAAQLLDNRRAILNQAMVNEKYGRLWREFDESLVLVSSNDRLYNTLDAAHFFNTHTLARGLTENRLIAAVPGFLTAVGVVGTFAGLQLGLAPLGELNPTDAKTEDLTVGIFGMIGGASIAFMTSVWGVTTSVFFNFFEKALERNIRTSITVFQNEVDYLYPRITAEQSLANIEESSRLSTEKLAELDEKIGNKMQEAMREASLAISQSMQDSLNTILGPAIEQLVSGANSGSERALESLLDRFLQGVGDAGEAQKALMREAAEDMKSATSSMSEGLNDFTDKLDDKIHDLVTSNASAMTAVQDHMQHNLRSMQESQSSLEDGIRGVLSDQKKQSAQIVSELTDLVAGFEKVVESNVVVSNAMQKSSSEMLGVANQLGVLATSIRESVIDLGSSIEGAASSVSGVSEQQKESLEIINQQCQALRESYESIALTSSALENAAKYAENGLSAVDTHFRSLGEALKKHVDEIEKTVSDLLTSYSSQVQGQTTERLNEWNIQTSEYIGTMTSAVNALGNVVEEIEYKLGDK